MAEVWSQILIIISALIGLFFHLVRISPARKDIKVAGIVLFGLIISIQIIVFIDFIYNILVREFLMSGILSLSYTILLMIIRNLKPSYIRFHYLYVFIPFILIFLFPFIAGSDLLAGLIFILMQGGGILVLAVLYFAHSEEIKGYKWGLGAAGAFLISFIGFWFLEDVALLDNWFWQLFLSAGVIFTSITLPVNLSHEQDEI